MKIDLDVETTEMAAIRRRLKDASIMRAVDKMHREIESKLCFCVLCRPEMDDK